MTGKRKCMAQAPWNKIGRRRCLQWLRNKCQGNYKFSYVMSSTPTPLTWLWLRRFVSWLDMSVQIGDTSQWLSPRWKALVTCQVQVQLAKSSTQCMTDKRIAFQITDIPQLGERLSCLWFVLRMVWNEHAAYPEYSWGPYCLYGWHRLC